MNSQWLKFSTWKVKRKCFLNQLKHKIISIKKSEIVEFGEKETRVDETINCQVR